MAPAPDLGGGIGDWEWACGPTSAASTGLETDPGGLGRFSFRLQGTFTLPGGRVKVGLGGWWKVGLGGDKWTAAVGTPVAGPLWGAQPAAASVAMERPRSDLTHSQSWPLARCCTRSWDSSSHFCSSLARNLRFRSLSTSSNLPPYRFCGWERTDFL